MVETARYDLFVSYAGADRAWVEGYLLDALEQAGVRLYSEAAFALGAPRLLEFERAVRQSRRTLLVISPAYLADNSGQFTDLMAGTYGLETSTWPVIPLILHPVALPVRLAMLQALDGTDADLWPAVVARLCAEAQRPVPQARPVHECPYPGMAPFREADAARFFGREREVRELVERLRLHSFITVIGPSGSGKSSLVYAGLLPALRQSRLFGLGDWLTRSLRPGEQPLTALASALAPRQRPAKPAPAELANQLASDRKSFGNDIAQAAAPDIAEDPTLAVDTLLAATPEAHRLLLFVDQLEETFTVARTDATAFQQTLLQLAEHPNCYVVVTVRADFYPELMVSPLWPKVQAHRMEVVPLNDDGLREAIVRPAENVGAFVEGALVERLVADAAGEPGALPLVQETLVLMWERLERRFLPLRAYTALVPARNPSDGIDSSAHSGLQVALARRADAALAELSPEQQAIARRIFLRLIQFGEGRADTRRQQPISALRAAGDDPIQFEQALRHLANNRLLTLSGQAGEGGRKVDIAHEALIAGWPTLQGWLKARREAEQIRRRLEDKAAEWARMGRGSSGLLDDIEVLEAERWLAGPDATDLGFDDLLAELARASRTAIEQAEQTRAEAQGRELAQARALAQAERRSRRRLQGLVAILGALVLIGLAVLARQEFLRQHARTEGNLYPVPGLEAQFEGYEVTNERYRRCVDAGRCVEPSLQLSTFFLPETASLPVTGVDAIQASAFCNWIGRRLPTRVEWEQAATHGGRSLWPWGDAPPELAYAKLEYDNRANQPDPVGSHPRGGTPEGIQDLIGNVWEWTTTASDQSGDQAGTTWDGQGATVPNSLTVVGGAYQTTETGIEPVPVTPVSRAPYLGFRCVEGAIR